MSLTKENIASIVQDHQRSEGDTGSAEVQVALLNARIQYLTEHFKSHTHDHTSRRGLFRLVGKQRRLLRYLYDTDVERYRALIGKLGLRDRIGR
ncbi:30S ribosomal protein S15 [Candidatus Poribacteria bacterium]|nr:30S ribosomal protein S15 [Candidatus Poribacteria bacterium]